MSIFYDQQALRLLRKNMEMSPHTILLINNPLHAQLCTGQDCRDRVNAAKKAGEQTEDAE